MKVLKFVLPCVIAALMGLNASAQSEKSGVDLTLGVGGYPVKEALCYGVSHDFFFRDDCDLSGLYSPSVGNVVSLGTISLQADLPVKKWFSVPFTVAGNLVLTSLSDPVNDRIRTIPCGTFSFLAGARFKYMNRPRVNFYSSLNIGIGFCTDYGMTQYSNDGKTVVTKYRTYVDAMPEFQVVPFGVRFGGKVYGIAEIGLGTLYCGGMLGVGVRL